MMNRFTILLVVLLLVAGSPASERFQQPAVPDWQAKVDPWVLETSSRGETESLIFLTQQADLSGAVLLPNKKEKGAYVYKMLTETAARTQKPLIAYLASMGIDHRPMWVANMIWVRADQNALLAIAQRSDVARLSANPLVRQQFPPIDPSPDMIPQAEEAIQWNLVKVRAPQVWAAGFTGQGVVIGGQDTGYQWEHPALKNAYRGWDGANADHNYNWHDAIHDPYGGGICGPDALEPCDDGYHGTHTMGIMVGDDGGSNQIGMAPGARWIGCRNMDEGFGTPASYAECYQWFIAPTDLNGQNPRPDLAPDVINNSWSCPQYEGCTDPNILLNVVENVRLAGIMTVHAGSNEGASCGTVNTPAAIYEASFTVGATDDLDNIAYFSSRGPVSVDGSYRLKPDVSAPGNGVWSSFPTYAGSYGYLSGTSMAAPHVAGLAALMISAQPGLAGQVDRIEKLISHNAVPRSTSQNCGGIPGSQIPNNTYGWGRIDAWQAVTNFEIQKSAETPLANPGEWITYTLQITQRYPAIVTNAILTDELPANTTFVSATPPYTLNGNSVQWAFPSLGTGEVRTVLLVVQAPASDLWTIQNQEYSVISDQTGTSPMVEPISVFVAGFFYMFPFIPNH